MPVHDVEIVRRMLAAVDAGDTEAALALLDPEFVFDLSRTNPEGRAYHGHDGVLEAMAQWTEGWDEYRVAPLELVPGPAGVVVAHVQERARIPGTALAAAGLAVDAADDGAG